MRVLRRLRLTDVALAVLAALVATAWYLLVTADNNSGVGSDTAIDVGTGEPESEVISSLWLGDSYTAGVGADSPDDGEACLAAAALDWDCNLDAEPGTGFLNDGKFYSAGNQPMIERLPTTRSEVEDVDVIVVDAGRNDGDSAIRDDRGYPLPELKAAISTYLAAVHDAYPDATIIQVVPYFMTQSEPDYGGELAQFIRTEMKQYGGQVIDPIAQGWVGERSTDGLVDPDGIHPNQDGHAYIAERLATAIRSMGVAS